MRDKVRGRGQIFVVIVLFLLACWLSVAGQRKPEENRYPRAGFNDTKPLGGKGLRLLLQRLGYTVQRHTARIDSMPSDARVWLLLDPDTGFSRKESWLLLQWVKDGGTLIWAAPPWWSIDDSGGRNPGMAELGERLKVKPSTDYLVFNGRSSGSAGDLPSMTPLSFGAASDLRAGVNKASGSGGTITIDRSYLELAGNPNGVEIGVIPIAAGHVIVLPDALLCSNYGLSKDDNAVLVSNFVRAYAPSGGVYFDERQHGDVGAAEKIEPNLLYYLSHGAARLALLQLATAGLLLWAFYGRRLGAPVPLPDQEPVTRAGQFALAMGMLFRKANRPRAAAEILGEEFRRALARRVGLSPHDPDAILANAAARATGLPERMIDRLLLKSKNPATTEAEALADAQDMETLLRHLDQRPRL